MIVRALCLRQPWASLVVSGAKRLETRSWRTPYRGPLVVTASAKLHPEDAALVAREPFLSAIMAGPDLALGAAIGVANLVGVATTEEVDRTWTPDGERAFGDFSPGRFAWILHRPWSAPAALSVRSLLGVFPLELPDDHPIAVEYAGRLVAR